MRTLLEAGLSNALLAGVLALLAFAGSRLRRPALAHGLWLLVLVKLLTPPLVALPLPWPADEPLPARPAPVLLNTEAPSPDGPGTALPSGSLADLADAGRPASQDPDGSSLPAPTGQNTGSDGVSHSWQGLAVAVWLGGSLLWFAATFGSVYRFRRALRGARPAPPVLQREAEALAGRLGLRRCPRVWLVPGVVSPMIWALGTAPRLLFPVRLLERLDADHRAALLLHELAHVRRRDHWVRLLEVLVSGLYWWHPVVWWARRELREAEEACCDAWVVWASAGDGHAYAQALLQAVAFVSRIPAPLPAGASGMGHTLHLRRRLVMIMQGRTPRSLTGPGWLAVLTLGAFLLPLAAQAQVPPSKDVLQDRDDKALQAEKLKRAALEDLKDQSAADKKPGKEAVSPEMQEALRAVAELKQQIAAKQKELMDLEVKLKSVLARIDGGKTDKGKAQYLDNVNKELKGLKEKNALWKERVEWSKDLAERERARAKEQALKAAEEAKALGEKLKDRGGAPNKPRDAKAAELEMRLEKLLREVEQLRRDIRGENPKQSK